MKQYRVLIKEVHYATYTVEAENAASALEIVRGGDGEFQELEFSHTLDHGGEVWENGKLLAED